MSCLQLVELKSFTVIELIYCRLCEMTRMMLHADSSLVRRVTSPKRH